ncbi:glycoside hydrolase family 99-like domain-containing protein [Flavobacterium sp. JAS]|uniref:glycoside hydrolase family 99-like domain-containing protein n=1 Tax=Flavobacterium sp. JAS TaxID=2897329 RepID=UPI001E460A24|nr:glycoside hydrolase family 99-like domain-containing protein [Flavobacterium sp. JAS]MCD0471085.1 glycoside hydrolase family 99-like domain-containing protein [Flavobacterium sp. JAS]
MDNIKPIAIYLPQFHPIRENDTWWGKGFTEWTNVTKAQPRFEGHYQPHLPADLGFYDLRLEEARLAQEQMAKDYGIQGFCYYHYWFNGKKLLQEPLDRKLKNPKENLSFMMCWANENWTRAWDGLDKEVLLKQEYAFEDDLVHINHLINYFKDDRYIKVNGKPVFIIYRPSLFPDIEKTIAIWRKAVKDAGFPDLYIGFAHKDENQFKPASKGFDFAFEFHPNSNCPARTPFPRTFFQKAIRKIRKKMRIKVKDLNYFIDYSNYVSKQMRTAYKEDVYPGITPMWDNSARRHNNSIIIHDSTPEKYKNWLSHIKQNYPWELVEENFLFINAWNEWAEGNHLEPCQKWGTAYLEATKEVIIKT